MLEMGNLFQESEEGVGIIILINMIVMVVVSMSKAKKLSFFLCVASRKINHKSIKLTKWKEQL
jgi:hypothetical protein